MDAGGGMQEEGQVPHFAAERAEGMVFSIIILKSGNSPSLAGTAAERKMSSVLITEAERCPVLLSAISSEKKGKPPSCENGPSRCE